MSFNKISIVFLALLCSLQSASQDIEYQIHEQSSGWSNWVKSGTTLGITGKRIEAVRIRPVGFPSNTTIQYRGHVQGVAWQNWVSNSQVAGTEGQSRRMEALQVKLVNMPSYSICYTTTLGQHKSKLFDTKAGTISKGCDGQVAGTTGERRPMDKLQITLRKDGIPVNQIEEKTKKEQVTFTRIFHSKTCDFDIYTSKKGGCSNMKFAGTIGQGKSAMEFSVTGKEELYISIKEADSDICKFDSRVKEAHMFVAPQATRNSTLREEIRSSECNK